jgi:hypothetical protein
MLSKKNKMSMKKKLMKKKPNQVEVFSERLVKKMEEHKINLYLGLKNRIYFHQMLRKKQEDCLEILTNQKIKKFRKFPKIRKKIAQLNQKHLYLVVSLQVGYLELLKKMKSPKQRI